MYIWKYGVTFKVTFWAHYHLLFRSIGSEDNSRQMEATGHTRDMTEGQDLDADTGGDTVQAVSQEKR